MSRGKRADEQASDRMSAWYKALGRTRNLGGKVSMVKAIYKSLTGSWPEDHFPEMAHLLARTNNNRKVDEVFPKKETA